MMNQQFAEMGSRGPQYNPAIKATCVAGRRAGRKGLMSFPSVIAHIETYMREELAITGKSYAPSSKIAEIWETDKPDWPEWAFINDQNTRDKLPTWARNELDWDAINRATMNRSVMMSQAPSTEYAQFMNSVLDPQGQHTGLGHMASSQADSSGSAGGVLIVVCVIAICWLSTRNRAVEEPARPVEPSPPSCRQEAPGDALACLRAARNFNLRSYKR